MANLKRRFETGEIRCSVCGDELPAFESNMQRAYACDKESCQARYLRMFTYPRKTIDVRKGEVQCQAPGCTNTVPPGRYLTRKSVFCCSATCRHKFYQAQFVVGHCLYCGNEIHDIPCHANRKYCCVEHRVKYYAEVLFPQKAGEFAGLLTEYLEGAARNNYKPTSWNGVQTNLLNFLAFIRTKSISDLHEVKPKIITAFIRHERKRGTAGRSCIGHVSTFCRWLQAEGHITASPVIPRIHRTPASVCAPRPLSDSELDRYWKLLEKDDSVLLKLALAIGEECGLRISEANNLRLQDVDLEAQQLFIRTPNKSDKPRRVSFSEKVGKYLREWRDTRNPDCPTDHLLHNSRLRPYNSSSLNILFQSHLRIQNGSPVPFSYHRLRHTWATRLINAGIEPAVLMELGGWQSWEAMKHYVQVLQTTIDRSYREAIANMHKQKELGSERTYSLLEFADMKAADEETPHE